MSHPPPLAAGAGGARTSAASTRGRWRPRRHERGPVPEDADEQLEGRVLHLAVEVLLPGPPARAPLVQVRAGAQVREVQLAVQPQALDPGRDRGTLSTARGDCRSRAGRTRSQGHEHSGCSEGASGTSALGQQTSVPGAPVPAARERLIRAEPAEASAVAHSHFHRSRIHSCPAPPRDSTQRTPHPSKDKGLPAQAASWPELPTTAPCLGGPDGPEGLCVTARRRPLSRRPAPASSHPRLPGLPSRIKAAALETIQQACGLLQKTHTRRTCVQPCFLSAPKRQVPSGRGLRGDHRQSCRVGLTFKQEEREKQDHTPSRRSCGGKGGSETRTAGEEPAGGWRGPLEDPSPER